MPDATVTAGQEPTDEAELLGVTIERRLAAQGKTPVDAERIDRLRIDRLRIDRLRQAVSDLNDAPGRPGS